MVEKARLLISGRGARVAGMLLVTTIVTSAAVAKRSVERVLEVEPALGEPVAGLVVPVDTISITAATPIAIAERVAAIGDEVSPGQPIVRIDDAEGRRALAQIELEVARATHEVADHARMVAWLQEDITRLVSHPADAPAQLALAEREAQQIPMRQARDSPERADLAHQQALLRVHRLEQLAADGLIARQEVDEAQFAVRLAADDLANAKLAADAAKRVQSAQARQARAGHELSLGEQRRQLAEQQSALEQSRLALKGAEMRYEATRSAVADPYVRASTAGALTESPVHAGDRVAAGALVAKLAVLDPMAIEIDVVPMIVNALHAGDVARVDVPAVGITARDGRIQSIAPIPGLDGKYAVRVALPNPSHARLAGQTAHVQFLLRVALR